MDDATSNWRQVGQVHLWHYATNSHGWHLTADDTASAALIQLLGLMRDAQFTAKQTIALSSCAADELPAANFPGRFKTYRQWNLVHSKPKHADDHWRVTADDEQITLEVGTARLDELRQGLENVRQGIGDYHIGTEGMELWFWWSVRKSQSI